MFDNIEELLRKIRLGEDTSFEIKSVMFSGEKITGPKRDELADELAAMANTHDSVMVLGVDDKTREILGISPAGLESLERYLFEICNESIKPPIQYRSFRLELPDRMGTMRPVLKIEVPRSLFVHESPNGYFFRQGSSKRKMTPEFLARLFQQRSQARLIRFEEQPVPRSSKADLSENLCSRFTKRSDEPCDVVLLKRNLLANEESGAVCASVAGILMCSEHPEKFLPNAYIEAVRYRGLIRDSNYQLDAQKITGPLDAQIKGAMIFYKRNQTVRAVKQPYRIELPQFSERAVFEAVVNAVAHRDYSISGSKIRLFMFDDRLELFSPGALPNTVTIDSIALRQSTRNELITSLLSEISVDESSSAVGRSYYMEKRGEGVPIIMKESEKISGKRPVFRLIDDSELLLTIYSATNENEL